MGQQRIMEVGGGRSSRKTVAGRLYQHTRTPTNKVYHICDMCANDAAVGLQHSPDVLPVNERPDAQVHHVPGRAVVIAHEVEGHGHMGMAVV